MSAVHELQELLACQIEARLRAQGTELDSRLRDALLEVPRHIFVRRDPATLESEWLQKVYSDIALPHGALPAQISTDSTPSFMVGLLQRVGIQPGDTVVELGSGGGFLAALVARLVGEHGQVIGVERVPSLARRARRALRSMGLRHASVIEGDAGSLDWKGLRANVCLITASVWDLPKGIFDLVDVGGTLLVPLAMRGPGELATVLKRRPDGFFSTWSTPARFVAFVGRERPAPMQWGEFAQNVVKTGVVRRWALPQEARRFRFLAYLSRVEPAFVMVLDQAEKSGRLTPAKRFEQNVTADPGCYVPQRSTLAIWRQGELRAFGTPEAAEMYVEYFDTYSGLEPRVRDVFQLAITLTVRAASQLSHKRGAELIEHRGETTFAWKNAASKTG